MGKRQKPEKPVHRRDGKVVGHVVGAVWYRDAHGNKDMLWRPRGWSFDTCTIREARDHGATEIQVTDLDTRTVYLASLETLDRFGVAVNRGHGDQRCLPTEYWQQHAQGQLPMPLEAV